MFELEKKYSVFWNKCPSTFGLFLCKFWRRKLPQRSMKGVFVKNGLLSLGKICGGLDFQI